jgi:hypothetical protein
MAGFFILVFLILGGICWYLGAKWAGKNVLSITERTEFESIVKPVVTDNKNKKKTPKETPPKRTKD